MTKQTLTITTPSDLEIVISRSFNAPRSMVFDAFTKPAFVERWLFGPSDWSFVTCQIDLRVGGAYRYVWKRGRDGHQMGLGGVFLEVVPPERTVHTERFDDAWYPGEALVTTVFTERARQTIVTMTMRFETKEGRDVALKSGMETGIELGYERLDRIFSEGREIKKVAFTMFPIVDTERARAFYEKTLGLTVGSHASNGVWTEYDLPGGGCLALFKTQDIKPSASAGGSIALEVDDLDRLSARLKAEGVTFKAELIHSPVCRMSVILDSEGNSIILHQLKKH